MEDTLPTSDTLATATSMATFLLLGSLHHGHLKLPEDLVKPGLQRLLDIEQQTQQLGRVGRPGLDFLLLDRQIILTNCSCCAEIPILLDSLMWSISVV